MLAIASLVYGVTARRVPVIEERSEEVEISIPGFEAGLPEPGGPGALPFGQPGEPGPPFDPSQPDQPPPEGMAEPAPPPFLPAPPAIKQWVTRTVQETKELAEPALVREVTVGGLEFLETGELRLTAAGQSGPALCPS